VIHDSASIPSPTTIPLHCRCAARGYVRSLEEEAWGFPDKFAPLARTSAATLGTCRHCGAWWEKLPHWVYGYAWYRTERRHWVGSTDAEAIADWTARRQDPGM